MRQNYYKWSDDKIEYVKQHYADSHSIDIANHLGVTLKNLDHLRKRLKLRKSEQYMKSGYFESLRMARERNKITERTSATQFKKGGKPKNTRPIGSIRKNKEGGYDVKIGEPKIWISRARKVWLDAGREIPKGYIVIHIDGNPENDELSNLECVHRINHLLRNQGENMLDDSLVRLIHAQAKLTKLLRKPTDKKK